MRRHLRTCAIRHARVHHFDTRNRLTDDSRSRIVLRMGVSSGRAAQRLRARRTRKRLTLSALCEQLRERGVDTSIGYLSDIERGRREPGDLAMVLAFEETLGVPAEAWLNFAALTRFLEMRRSA